MNNTIKGLFALTLLASATVQAAYVIHIPTEAKLGGHLADGSIIFKGNAGGNNGGGETPIEPEVPVEPETPEEEPVKDIRELLYTVSLGIGYTLGSDTAYGSPNLNGSPLSCGDLGTNCFWINSATGNVIYRYMGHTTNFENTFYHPDAIVVRSGFFTSSECNLTNKSISILNGAGGSNMSLTYSCGAGSLYPTIKPTYTTISFIKINKK